ncbi:MAG TPA: amino acid-binding ACT domain-containing protein [Acidimicrobiia bacterium]|nr:amino acid-binding ACT domain-containing protein [Acidimicrobiia bacterium]
MTEFTVRLANAPGMLAALAERLDDAGVHIEAVAAFGAGARGVVHLVVSDSEMARSVLRGAGMAFEERPVLTTELPPEPGALARMARRLADSGVNIEALYLLRSSAEGLEFAVAVDRPDAVPLAS